ncbi:M28 family peptidase [Clostridium uliginosum]|uniref:Peptidase family M28 n=1 Tax=Clostridium uliginosum TaxID=119641 RepID=A0A1I1RB12_9CLOT|nr:M28 family peptidase [Clostridium uliginosum]SFD28743.1 Peptidase family M28 [Clostridium uliginosum]
MGGFSIKYIFKISIILILILNITGCDKKLNTKQMKDIEENRTAEESQNNIDIPDTTEIIDTLCSDDFGGRLVGSKGDQETENYIFKIIKDLKLEPLFDEEYYEPYTQEVYKNYGLIDDNDKPENKEIHNLVGVIKGSDSTKAVVISAHFDHIGYQDGKIIRGALDNASGVATLIRIADILKKQSQSKTFSQDIIIAFFDGEETSQQGSKAFVNDIKDRYSNLYNINIDCVGGKKAGKISLNNKSKISNKLTVAMKETFKNNNMDFSDVELKGATSDHKSFEKMGITNIYIGQEDLKPYVHNETDNPDTLNCDEIEKVANVIGNFIEINDGQIFKE